MLLNVPAVCLLDFTCDASIVTAQRRDQWSPVLTGAHRSSIVQQPQSESDHRPKLMIADG